MSSLSLLHAIALKKKTKKKEKNLEVEAKFSMVK